MTTPQTETGSAPPTQPPTNTALATPNPESPQPVNTGGSKKGWVVVISAVVILSITAYFVVSGFNETKQKADDAIDTAKTTVVDTGAAVQTGAAQVADSASQALESENVQDAVNNTADAVNKGVDYVQSDKAKEDLKAASDKLKGFLDKQKEETEETEETETPEEDPQG